MIDFFKSILYVSFNLTINTVKLALYYWKFTSLLILLHFVSKFLGL
ncbi:hypothetical protein EA94_01195 [Enterococcus faecalis]|nr:hypothetical protein EA94_01195 [Enterococcus faecalis]